LSAGDADGQSIEEKRAHLLGTASAGLSLLASLADGPGLADVRASFLSVASVWSEDQASEETTAPPLRIVSQDPPEGDSETPLRLVDSPTLQVDANSQGLS